MLLSVDSHPLLDLGAFVTQFPTPLGELSTPEAVTAQLALPPAPPGDAVRAAVRELLRKGGFKPTGRSKPASEYLLGAARQQGICSINLAVDACNASSLHSGLPISVVDLALAAEPLRVAIAPEGASYVFNASGQVIDIGGLLCLFDEQGPCANAVKDAQRTKTGPHTRSTLSLVWGTLQLPGLTASTVQRYRQMLEDAGAHTEAAAVTQ